MVLRLLGQMRRWWVRSRSLEFAPLVPNWNWIMPKKSARVVLTLLGSAAFGVGCSQAPPPPPAADSFASQIDFEKDPEDKPGSQPVNGVGQTAAAPTTGTGNSSHYYHRGPSIWPLFWMMSSRQSSPTYQPGTPSSVPRGPSHVTPPPPIPTHSGHTANSASSSSSTHTTPSHTSTTHTGSTSHVSSHGFGSTGHSISGGS